MTKLEQKLIELGYRYNSFDGVEKEYVKLVNGATLYINYDVHTLEYGGWCWADTRHITRQTIKLHKQAFNQLQNDLKELERV